MNLLRKILTMVILTLFWLLRCGVILFTLTMLLFCGLAGINAKYQFLEITIGFSGLDVLKLIPPALALSLIVLPFFVWLDYRLLRRRHINQMTSP